MSSVAILEENQLLKWLTSRVFESFLRGDAPGVKEAFNALISQTIGFASLSIVTGVPAAKLRRLFSNEGTPTLEDMTLILDTIWKRLKVEPGAEGSFKMPGF